jgi:hypothetical protein
MRHGRGERSLMEPSASRVASLICLRFYTHFTQRQVWRNRAVQRQEPHRLDVCGQRTDFAAATHSLLGSAKIILLPSVGRMRLADMLLCKPLRRRRRVFIAFS